MSSNYNRVLRPPVVFVSGADTGSSSAGNRDRPARLRSLSVPVLYLVHVDEPQSSEKRGHDVVHVGLLATATSVSPSPGSSTVKLKRSPFAWATSCASLA